MLHAGEYPPTDPRQPLVSLPHRAVLANDIVHTAHLARREKLDVTKVQCSQCLCGWQRKAATLQMTAAVLLGLRFTNVGGGL